jgi:hypothetical protein
MLGQLQNSINLARHDIDTLETIFEMTTRQESEIPHMRGHYAGNEYFFFKNGKEVFRSSDRASAINFLSAKYCNYVA